MNTNDNYICEDTCDSCRERAAGVMFHHMGIPVMFMCHKCDPKNFEYQATYTVAHILAQLIAA